jgi:tetratricopeptide (TPR) repeat protein
MTRRTAGLLAVIAVLAVAGLGRDARAQHRADTKNIDAARAKFDVGRKEYRLGNYDEAIRVWKEAYLLYDDPNFLFNIGLAYRDKGDHEQAVKFLKNYLREAKNPPNREQVQQRIAELERLISERKANAERPPTSPQPPTEPQAEGAATGGGGGGETLVRNPGRGLRLGGLVTGGVGVALLGTGVYFGLHANSIRSDVEAAVASGAPWTDDLAAKDDEGRSSATIANITLGLGAGALITGGVLYYLGARKAKEVNVVFYPTPRRGGFTLAATGSF